MLEKNKWRIFSRKREKIGKKTKKENTQLLLISNSLIKDLRKVREKRKKVERKNEQINKNK